MKKSTPLINIYNKDKKDEFLKLLADNKKIKGDRKNILLNLPTYVINDELLNKILNENKVSKEDKFYIINQINIEKNRIINILQDNKILDEISLLNEEEFSKNNYSLDLSNLFYEKINIKYSYEDYQKHIKLLKEFKKNNKNYDYKINKGNIFKNINIHIINSKMVIITKTNLPTTHFVIYHPKLIDAIQNFKVSFKEKNVISD